MKRSRFFSLALTARFWKRARYVHTREHNARCLVSSCIHLITNVWFPTWGSNSGNRCTRTSWNLRRPVLRNASMYCTVRDSWFMSSKRVGNGTLNDNTASTKSGCPRRAAMQISTTSPFIEMLCSVSLQRVGCSDGKYCDSHIISSLQRGEHVQIHL